MYMPHRHLLLGLLDLCNTPGYTTPNDNVEQPHFRLLMATLKTMRTSKVSMPAIWLWIVNSMNRLNQAAAYARLYFPEYSILQSKYIHAKNERLYDSQACIPRRLPHLPREAR
jgi:hypothetical protein